MCSHKPGKARETAAKKEDAGEEREAGSDDLSYEERLAWFEEVYQKAEGDAEQVPWAALAPHPLLESWSVDKYLPDPAGLSVIDIGCGLGDNARWLAEQGFKVTAFDLSATAIKWARTRLPDSKVDFSVQNLFSLSDEWKGKYDLVHETFTLQALSEEIRPLAARHICELVKDKGFLLLICLGRDDSEECSGPPWPLGKQEVKDLILPNDMVLRAFEEETVTSTRTARHFRVVFQKIAT